jgi:F-type H+-transporting ATPase subunit b
MATTPPTAGTLVPGNAPPKSAVFPPFDTATFVPSLVWLAITFGALYLLMSRIALPRVTEILESRQARITGDIDAATAMQAKAAEAGVAYEKTLADAKARAQATAQQTRDQLAAEAEAKRKSLEAELNAKLAAAETQVAAMKAQAMTNVGAIASEAADAIVRQITGRAPDATQIANAVAAARNG